MFAYRETARNGLNDWLLYARYGAMGVGSGTLTDADPGGQ
jgi:hypothetical protein